MRWYFILILLNGHISWEGPMRLDDCTALQLSSKADSKKEYMRACVTKNRLDKLLKTGKVDDHSTPTKP